jgi:hypothetical protein
MTTAHNDASLREGMNMTSVREPDAARLAAIDARASSRHAHHEAGHAVAAVMRGGTLLGVWLGTTDWSTPDGSADTPGGCLHETALPEQPFVTFAGPWAEAMWNLGHEDVIDDFDWAFEIAWENNGGGDTDEYESRVEMLTEYAEELGLSPIRRAWESMWAEELELLWPAVCEVAVMLLGGQQVTHEQVKAVVDRYPIE